MKLAEHCYTARVKRVVDGDTVDLEIDLGFYVAITQRIRLARCNAPEKADWDGFQKAKVELERLLPMGKDVPLICHGKDRYGRWIGDIGLVPGGGYVSDELVKLGVAQPYVPRSIASQRQSLVQDGLDPSDFEASLSSSPMFSSDNRMTWYSER